MKPKTPEGGPGIRAAPNGAIEDALPSKTTSPPASVTPNGGSRRRGRPTTVGGDIRQVRLMEAHVQAAIDLGQGNLSSGIRLALDVATDLRRAQGHEFNEATLQFLRELGAGDVAQGLQRAIQTSQSMTTMQSFPVLDVEIARLKGGGDELSGLRKALELSQKLGAPAIGYSDGAAIPPQDMATVVALGDGDFIHGLRRCITMIQTLGDVAARRLSDGS